MCRRISQHFTWGEIDELYDLVGAARKVEARYNISPTKTVDAVAALATGNTLIPMRWGFVPSWWRRSANHVPSNFFNLPAEIISKNPIFRSEFKRNRCIIPASGYFKWKETPDGKQPYFIGAADGGVLSIAGMCDARFDADDGVSSCTMIVTSTNTGAVRHCMPVLLDRADCEPWLNGTAGPELLKPVDADRLRMWAVSKRVNEADGYDDPTLIEEIAA